VWWWWWLSRGWAGVVRETTPDLREGSQGKSRRYSVCAYTLTGHEKHFAMCVCLLIVSVPCLLPWPCSAGCWQSGVRLATQWAGHLGRRRALPPRIHHAGPLLPTGGARSAATGAKLETTLHFCPWQDLNPAPPCTLQDGKGAFTSCTASGWTVLVCNGASAIHL